MSEEDVQDFPEDESSGAGEEFEDAEDAADAEHASDSEYDEDEIDQDIDPALQAALDKQLDRFRSTWLRMDSSFEEEQVASFRVIVKSMAKINAMHEEMTGEKNLLTFADLLDKIENGGGASDEDLEELYHIIAQYEEANDALKTAEEMLSSELRMLRFLLKTKGYEKMEIESPAAVIDQLLDKAPVYQALCDNVRSFLDAAPEDIAASYTARLNALQDEEIAELRTNPTGFTGGLTAWLLKRQGLASSVEELIEIQALTNAQDRMMREDQGIIDRLQDLETLITDLEESVQCVLHQNYADQALKKMMADFESLELRLQKNEDLRQEIEAEKRERQALHDTISELKEENARKAESIRLLNGVIDKLRGTVHTEAPLEDPELEELSEEDQDDHDILRARCEKLMSQLNGDTENDSEAFTALRRENSLLREQVAMLKDSDPQTRFEIVERSVLQRLIDGNQRLETEVAKQKERADSVLNGSASWNEKFSEYSAKLKAEFDAALIKMREEEAQDIKDALKRARDEKRTITEELQGDIATLKTQNKALEDKLESIESARAQFRRKVMKEAHAPHRRGYAMASGFALAAGIAGVHGYDYASENYPEYIPWVEAETIQTEQTETPPQGDIIVTSPLRP